MTENASSPEPEASPETSPPLPPESPEPPPPPPLPPPVTRRLFRSRNDRVISGFAGGIAEYLGIDPIIVRLVFVALAFAGFLGVFLYVIGWIFVPEVGSEKEGWSPPESLTELVERPTWVTALVVILVALVIVGGFNENPGIVWPLLLVALGVYLLSDRQVRSQGRAGTTPTESPSTTSGITTPAYGAAPAAAPRERSRLGALTVGLAMLATGVAVITQNLEWTHLSHSQMFALPIVILGMGLLVGAWVGRARWLVLPAILLLPLAAIGNATDVANTGGVGPREYRPVVISDLRPSYDLGVGKLVVDLSQVTLPETGYELKASVGVGEVVVVVPRDSEVRVNAEVGLGEAQLFNETSDGGGVELGTTHGTSGPDLNLKVEAGIGHVVVTDNPQLPEALQ